MRRRLLGNRSGITGFITTWDTRNTKTGSSASNQIKLPLYDSLSAAFDFIVDWGDGTTNHITTWDQVETLHTYTTEGIKTISITGTIRGFSFYSYQVESLKILNVVSWGDFETTGDGRSFFRGCSNLDLSSVQGVPKTLNGVLEMFWGCTNLTIINGLENWDTSQCGSFWNMFRDCPNFNQPLNFDMSSATAIREMFRGCTQFNSPVLFTNMNNVSNMNLTFYYAVNFNQDISDWNVSNVTVFGGNMFMEGNTVFSTQNLDLVYQKWSQQNVQPNQTISFNNTKYSSAGQAGRDTLVNTYGWTITDGGLL